MTLTTTFLPRVGCLSRSFSIMEVRGRKVEYIVICCYDYIPVSGGSPAEFEPFHAHLQQYEWALAQYLGYGVAACYRGPRYVLGCRVYAFLFQFLSQLWAY